MAEHTDPDFPTPEPTTTPEPMPTSDLIPAAIVRSKIRTIPDDIYADMVDIIEGRRHRLKQ